MPSTRPIRWHLSLLRRTIEKSLGDGAGDLASSIAFYGVFSLFPLLIVLVSLSSFILESGEARERVYTLADAAFPGSASLVKTNIEAVLRLRGAMGVVGLLGLLWSASAGFGAMSRAMNLALGLESEDSYVRPYLRYLGMTVVVLGLLAFSVGLIAASDLLFRPEGGRAVALGVESIPYASVASRTASCLLVTTLFAVVYRMAPRVDVRWLQVLPGAVLAACVFELGKLVFLYYMENVARYEVVYGSLSSIMVLLAWLYLSALTLVFGAEYNIVLAREADAPHDENEEEEAAE